MKNPIIIAIVVLVIALGFGFYLKNSQPKEVEVVDNSDKYSVSFSCTDGLNFIAEFLNDNSLNVIVAGNIAKNLVGVDGDGKRFEDNDVAFVFAGEEVSIHYKAQKRTVICNQPFDPNNAPMNFGDRGEGSGEKPDIVAIVNKSILGKWQSADDAKFVREFIEGGKSIDYYDGEVTSEDSWVVSEKENGPNLEIKMSTEAEENLNFRISKLTFDTLELVYLDRGGVLTFSKVQE